MKRFIIVAFIVFCVVAYMVTYRVLFTETAVETTFGQASDQPITEPGLQFIVPYVQNVVKYDKRPRYLESKPETVQTSDENQVVITSYLVWKVSDPKLFFQRFSGNGAREANHYRGAERVLNDKLRSAMGEISRYRFDELLSTSHEGSKLEECEKKLLDYLTGTTGAESLPEKYGIEPVAVGIIGMELPEENTSVVFETMKTNRAAIANDAISQGNAIAETIRSTAKQDARTIVEFAQSRASAIRAEGIAEAAKYQEQLQKHPELAVFIRNMELMKETLGNNRVTIMLPVGPRGWPGFELFQPSFMDQLKSGKLNPFPKNRVPTPGSLEGGAIRSDDEKSAAVEAVENTGTPTAATGGNR